jgi:ribosomal protein S21
MWYSLDMINATRVEVRRGKNESSASLIRRFSRRSQGLGLLRELRKRRYFIREKSDNVDHARAMVRGKRSAEYHELVKLGKIDPATYGKKGKRK